jgi:hypothetical protein
LLTIGAGGGGATTGGVKFGTVFGFGARLAIAEDMEARRPTRMRSLSDDVFISGVGYANSEALMRQNGGNVQKNFAKVRNPILISADYQILLSFLAND